jgi:4-phospho-D-threonate 3-dehydrogenase / 4-phospho-D-erythronate 3-dehydrogenase
MNKKPLIAITMGDPAGIGPEIIAKAMGRNELFEVCKPFVIGDAGVMKKMLGEMRLPVTIRSIASPKEADPADSRLDILDCKNVDLSRHAWGAPDKSSGLAVVDYIKKAVDLCMKNETDAMVTAPISKEVMNAAGHHFSGHTEPLAHLTNTEDFGMMFVGGGLMVILVTIHVALKDVSRHVTTASVLKTLRLAHKAMKYFGMDKPRIGVDALDSPAGGGRLFGSEDRDEILPAVLKARQEGIDASDPLPADTLFFKARNNYYDIVAAMYHDQGLAPLKMLAFGNAVNVTVGLPIIRTSVDHGTAYDIAGKGCADPESLIQAVKLAAYMAKNRQLS